MPIPAGPDASIMTVADAKQQLNIPTSDTSQDGELAGYIDSVTEVIEHIVGPVVPREVVEVHDGGTEVLILRRPPVLTLTTVVESGITLAAADYSPRLDAGILYRVNGRWATGRDTVTVTYQAGRTPTPANIKLAAKELAMVNFRPQLGGDYSPFDTDSPEEGIPGEVRLGFFVPNRVRELLKPHEQGGWLP